MKSKTIATLLFLFISCFCFAQSPEWLWAQDGNGNNQGYSIDNDKSGNVYVTGAFTDPVITFGNITLTNTHGNSSQSDLFIVKYDGAGIVLWARNFGSAFHTIGQGISSDDNGNVYLTGIFEGPQLILGSITLINSHFGEYVLFIAKFDTDGNLIWAKCPDGLGRGSGICVTSTGSIYLTGIASQIIFDADTLQGGTIFLAKYDSSGNVLWARNSLNKRWGWSYSVAADADENAIITTSFMTDSAVFGTDTLFLGDTSSYHNAFVKYDRFGNELWARAAGNDNYSYVNCVATDLNNNAIITGSFNKNSIAFGGHVLSNIDTNSTLASDIYFVKYDPYGNVLWAKSAGGMHVDQGQTVSTDAEGNIYATGKFRSDSIILEGSVLINNGGICFSGNCFNIFIAKYDSSGNMLWYSQPGGANNGYVRGSSVDTSSDVYITGIFQNDLIFGNTTLLSNGTWEYFVAKLDHIITSTPKYDFPGFKIYPNPSNGIVMVSSLNKIDELKITNIAGQVIQQIKPGSMQVSLQLEAAGFYLLTITINDRTATKKLIISK